MMTEREEHQACNALIEWLRSQNISPGDAIPVMALAMVTAIVSCIKASNKPAADQRKMIKEGVEVAAETVRDALKYMKKAGGGLKR